MVSQLWKYVWSTARQAREGLGSKILPETILKQRLDLKYFPLFWKYLNNVTQIGFLNHRSVHVPTHSHVPPYIQVEIVTAQLNLNWSWCLT